MAGVVDFLYPETTNIAITKKVRFYQGIVLGSVKKSGLNLMFDYYNLVFGNPGLGHV